ncbi:MAG TPA: metallophosphoesterase [Caulobacteraceae bacterium]
MTVRLIHFTDIHFGAVNMQAVEAATAFAHETEHDLLVISGDITQTGRPAEFEACAAWMTGLPPHIVCPGNHDTAYYNVWLRIVAPWARYRRWIGATEDVEHRGAGLSVRTLNTARGIQFRRNWSKGAADLKDFDAAGRAVAAASAPGDLRVIVCHHPLMEVLGEPITGEVTRGRAAATVLNRHAIDVVMTGHLHVPFAATFPCGDERTHCVGASTLSLRERGVPIGFNVVEAEDDVIRVRAMGWNGSSFDLVKSWSLPRRRRDAAPQTGAG